MTIIYVPFDIEIFYDALSIGIALWTMWFVLEAIKRIRTIKPQGESQ